MTVDVQRRIIGFDRKIQLDWLDATAEWAAQGLSVADMRAHVEQLLAGKVAGDGSHSARGKTMTVLLHIWVLVPEAATPLRDEGLALLRERVGRDRLALHWGMCLATYPFFHDVATITGRLLSLQHTAAMSQIVRRMAESWGERSTVTRAAQRVVRSLIEWGALTETDDHGVFAPGALASVPDQDKIGPWILEAGMLGAEHQTQPFRSLVTAAAFFPFTLHVSPQDVGRSPRLEVSRQGLDQDMVVRKGGTQQSR